MIAISRRTVPITVILTVLSAALAALLAPAPARADRIDGYWCRGVQQLFIDGPRIVTPGGKDMTGEYDRHGFRYVVPAGEPDAGAAATMMQLNEDLMQRVLSTRPGAAEDWLRCAGRVS